MLLVRDYVCACESVLCESSLYVRLWECLHQVYSHTHSLTRSLTRREGTMLVTASVTGTVLRLFAVPSGEHLCSFRRGTRSALITSLCFSQRSTVLAVGSSSGTVHVFDVWAGLRKRVSEGVSEGGSGSGSKSERSDDESVSECTSGGGGHEEGSWSDSLTHSARSYLTMAQSWSKAAVSGLQLLPQPMQEFAESMWYDCHSLTHSLTYSLTFSLTYSLTYSLTHLLTYSLTHSLTHSLTQLSHVCVYM
jgi:WD40 repeat protein